MFPLHSHVLATDPLTDKQVAALGWGHIAGFSDDLNRISYCSLTPDKRIVFGGGSNDSYHYLFNNKTAYRGNRTPAIQAMQETLYNYFPSLREVRVSHMWTGTLSITLQRNCSVGVIGDNLYYGLGYSGHGVTLSNLAGEVIADMIAGTDEQWRDLPFYQAKLMGIPLEPFRWIGYQMFTRLIGRSPSFSED